MIYVQALKADKPRLSACTSKGQRLPPPVRVRFLALANSLAAPATTSMSRLE
jgi:hypothetical protein